ncbi:MAG: DUF1080 domain-containing protein [Prevotellaceae bacterium]|jgi:HEAT repeat protein|nr:DUF1080 domain-containing protein [Prevotellaceae bacterium]
MIRNLILSLILILGLCTYSDAQTDNRTRKTKIADIVMLLPAQDAKTYSNLIGELYSLGNVVEDLAPNLAPPGGADAQIRYAIAGLAMYASQNDSYSRVIETDICKAIASVNSDEIRDFLLIQLQYVAGKASVETALKYLENDRLCDAAARVLVRTGSEDAGKTLLKMFENAKVGRKITAAQALGELKYEPALTAIAAAATDADINLRKAALYSLSLIANTYSETVLRDAAQKTGYVYEPSDALGAYLRYLYNRIETDEKQVMTASAKLLKATSEQKQLAAKTAALKLYVIAARSTAEDNAVKEIIAALKSGDRKYRRAALDASLMLKTPKMYGELLKALKKEKSPETKADIIYALGVRGCREIERSGAATLQNPLKDIQAALKDASPDVRTAAIEAVGNIYNLLHVLQPVSADGQITVANLYKPVDNEMTKNCTGDIIAAMNIDSKDVVETGKRVLLSLKNMKLADEVASAMFDASPAAEVALIEILAERRAANKFDNVYALASVSDGNKTGETPVIDGKKMTHAPTKEIYIAAVKALKDIATPERAQPVAMLLNASSDAEITAYLQDALYAAVSTLPVDEQTKRITGLMKTGRRPAVYYNVYAKIGGADALKFVLPGLKSEKDKDAAFDALTRWNGDAAIASLLEIAKTDATSFDRALEAYIAKTVSSKNKPEQKLLMLRNALAIAKTSKQKTQIINGIEKTGTFLGLVTAGKYLDDADQSVAQAAVQAVRKIALSNKNYCGDAVTTLLNRAIAVNRDPEAAYQKEEILKHIASLPDNGGFVSLFNGKDLTGWKGLLFGPNDNPLKRAQLKPAELTKAQAAADEDMRKNWVVKDGALTFLGHGHSLATEKQYGDFELYVDWNLDPAGPEADAGIYLRGTPQVQIWDTARRNVGAQVGSGGLYNNSKNPSKPLKVADNGLGEWNSFYIKMLGEKVTVYLNGELVTDNVTLENYWNRALPIFPVEQIELQAHGSVVQYRDIYIREIPRPEPYKVSDSEKAEGFVPMFNGVDMNGWTGNLTDYVPDGGVIKCIPTNHGHGNLYTEKEYANFIMRFEFKLTPAANNGLGIRTPLEGDAAYVGMELQILDSEAEVYKDLAAYQYHGSVYGVIPAKRGYLKPTGEWNVQEVIANGNKIKITLNGTVILDGDIAEASKNFTATADKQSHPGLSNKTGHIAFLGHGSELEFRNIRIKELKEPVKKTSR